MYNSNEKIEIAQEYLALGWKVFPCHTIEDEKCSCGKADCNSVAKHPLTPNGVKDATDDPEKIKRYFGGSYEVANIGLATGEDSGVFALDEDLIGSLKELEAAYKGPLPKTVEAKTARGFHLLYRNPDGVKIKTSHKEIHRGIDVRGEGGYIILPPSVHASGNNYEWIHSPHNTPIADAPEWLLRLVSKDVPTNVSKDAKTVNETFIVQEGLSERERAIAYLEKTPPAISGEGGHNHTFGVVCHLIEHFPSLSDDEILDVIDDWNERCEPPWSVKELRHKIKSARDRVGDNGDTPKDVQAGNVFGDEDETEDWPVLSPNAYHGLAGEFIKTIEPHTEADPVALLITFLNAFGNIVGRSPHFNVEGDRHHVNTFVCIVGQSSRSRKGTSLGYILSVFRDVDDDWNDCRINGLSTGEGIVNRLRDNEDGTIPDKRLWVVESEFSQPLKVMKRDQNTLSPIVRNLWDRGDVSILTRANPLRAVGCHVSILGHITQEELSHALSEGDLFNGFANRFLWCLARRSKMLPLGGGNVLLDSIKERLSVVTQEASQITMMELSPEARALYCDRYASLGSGRRGLWDAVTSRAEPQVIRLAMLYALLDGQATIETDHLKAALAVWDYCDDSARLIFGTDGGNSLERKIMELLREGGKTKTEIRDKVSSSKATRKALTPMLDALVSSGRVEMDGQRYVVRPSVLSVSLSGQTKNGQNGQRTGVSDSANGQNGQNGQRTGGDPESVNGQNGQTDNGHVEPATLPELLDWRNQNSAEFFKREDGSCWVTKEDRLTPSLKAALEANQETLKRFVPTDDENEDVDTSTLSVDGREFLKELSAPKPEKKPKTKYTQWIEDALENASQPG